MLQTSALLLALAAAVYWAAAGANTGWTKTSVPVKTVDEVTGIEGIQYEKHFLPGVELLGLALLTAGALAGGSFLIKTNPSVNPKK